EHQTSSRGVGLRHPTRSRNRVLSHRAHQHRAVKEAEPNPGRFNMDGIKHILGLWIADNEGAAFWASVCADLANRGVQDVFIVCCDGLKGLPEAVEATWPNSMVQTCIVHLIRASNRWVSHQDRKSVSRA
ncbi:transposase, partial [Corynebacterium evansiae]|uniref:transposase n=1 Tax=Corynebacterium evansiae TaxID=2913499 RepID=UPI003EB6E7E4